jgi:hypothetical protein
MEKSNLMMYEIRKVLKATCVGAYGQSHPMEIITVTYNSKSRCLVPSICQAASHRSAAKN